MIGFLIFTLIVILAAVILIYCADLLLAHWSGVPALVPTLVRVIIILVALLVILQRGLPLVGGPSLTSLVVTEANAQSRVTVRPRPARPVQPIAPAAPLVVLPPLLVFYDIQRRGSCIGDPLGLGGPGFSEPIKPGQNVKPPPDCSAQPKRR